MTILEIVASGLHIITSLTSDPITRVELSL